MTMLHKNVKQICGREGRKVFVITPKKELNVDLKNLNSSLKKMGYNIKIKGNLGLSFTSDMYKLVSVLRSGIMIIEGPKSNDEAYEFYKKIIKI